MRTFQELVGDLTVDVLSYSETRTNLKAVMERVVAGRTPVVSMRQNAEAVVMVSLADWNAMEETLHLLSGPTNAARLGEAVEALESGKGTVRSLIEA